MPTVEVSATLTGQQQVVQGLDQINKQLENLGKQGVESSDKLNKKLTETASNVKALTAVEIEAFAERLGHAFKEMTAFLIDSTKASIEYATHLNNLSRQIGVSTDDLQALELAAKQNGTSLDAIAGAMRRLSALAGGMEENADNLTGAFRKYNIELKNADGTQRDAMDLLYAVSERIKTATTNTERLSIASGFFGRQIGAQLIPILSDGAAGLDRMKNAARELGVIIDSELIKAGAEAGDKLDAMSMVIRNNVYSALLELSPLLIKVAEELGVISAQIIDFLTNVGILDQADLPLTIQIRQLRNEVKLAQDQLNNEIATNPFHGTWLYNTMGGDTALRKNLQDAQDRLDVALEQRQLRSRLGRGGPAGGAREGSDFSTEYELQRQSDALRNQMITAQEEHDKRLALAQKLLQAGVEHGGISWVEYGKAVQFANDELKKANEAASRSSGSTKALSDAQREAARIAKQIADRNADLAAQQDKDREAAFARGRKTIEAMTAFNKDLETQEANLVRLADAQKVSNREYQVTVQLIQLEAQWRRINGALTVQDTENLRKHAEKLVDLGQQIDLSTEQWQELADLQGVLGQAAGNAFNTIGRVVTGNLRSASDAFEAFRNIGLQAIDDLLQAMINLAILNPLKGLFGGEESGGMGGLFSIIQGIIGGLGGGWGTTGMTKSQFWSGGTGSAAGGGLQAFFQTGGDRVFSRPSLIAVGETGNPERVRVEPLANGGGMDRGRGGGIIIDARGSNGSREIERAVQRAIRRAAPGLIESAVTVVQARNRKDASYLGS